MSNSPSLQKFFSDVLGQIERDSRLKAFPYFTEELTSLEQRINDKFFRMAVIGEFSSGKSTFINAMLGKDILSHATKETTAVLTRIVTVAENDTRKGSAVAFMKNSAPVTIPRLDELKEYTTAVSTKYQVAREIEGVEIYVPLEQVTSPLIIMDTPGLNGIAEGHLEQTKEIVKRAHACIYLVQQRGFTKDDLEFLTENLVPYQQRFIFVQNFIDEFNSFEGETVADRIISLRKILTEKVFNDSDGHEFFICGVSALKELVSRDETIKRLYATDTEDLTDDERRKLAQESGFEDFRKILRENFDGSRLDEIKYRDTAVAIYRWVKMLTEKISRRLSADLEVYATSREKNLAEKIDGLIKKIRDRQPKNLEAIRGFIVGEVHKLNRELDKLIADTVTEAEQKLSQEINSCTTPEHVAGKNVDFRRKIPREWERICGATVEYCKISFQNLYQLVMERVEEYSGIRSIRTVENFNATLPAEQREFRSYSLDQYEKQIREARANKSNEEQALRTANSNVSNAKSNVQRLEYESNDTQRRIDQKRQEIRRMGSRPAERVWYETVEVKRGGFFGSIMDFFSTKTEQRRRTDDSERRRWDEEHSRLESQQNSLVRERDDVMKRLNAANDVLKRYQRNASDNAEKIRRLEQTIRDLEQRAKLERERAAKELQRAREQYLSTCKNLLREDMAKYFSAEKQNLSEELQRQTAVGEQKLFSEAAERLKQGNAEKISELEQMKRGNTSPLQEKIAGLEQSKNNLERCAAEMEARLS